MEHEAKFYKKKSMKKEREARMFKNAFRRNRKIGKRLTLEDLVHKENRLNQREENLKRQEVELDRQRQYVVGLQDILSNWVMVLSRMSQSIIRRTQQIRIFAHEE